ncbi:hypothetical protein HYT01_01105 [Candidatus Giovannonibacteria bacterium]|nr:hypothetical protein [Candidatus Giovannonibacteria bacterium]
MGEIIKFQESKEVIVLERQYGDFEARYDKLKFLALNPKGKAELETLVGELVKEIETFEEELSKAQTDILERDHKLRDQFQELSNEKDFSTADEKYGTESAQEMDRLLKLQDLEDKAAKLKERSVSFLA